MKCFNLIFFGFVVSLFFYSWWYDHNSYVFGKSDVDNYFRFRDYPLTGLETRHVFMQFLVSNLPMYAFVAFIPALFWFGIVWQTYDLFGEDAVFNLVFGTAAVPLFFIMALWSQFLSVAILLLGLRLKERGNAVLFYCCIVAACIYLPTIYYLLSFAFSAYLLATALLLSLKSQFYDYSDWVPALSFILYVSPPVLYAAFFGRQRLPAKERAKWLIMSLIRLGRGFIYLFFDIRIKLDRRSKIVSALWWLAAMAFFLNDFKSEMLYCSVVDGCRVFYPMF